MKSVYKKNILYVVLNWGLGHASRSVPIIRHYLEQGHTITIGSDGRALAFLKKAFPRLEAVELPAYQIQYPHNSIVLNILRYSFPILKGIQKEHVFIKTLVQEKGFDLIISDNRYGAYADIPSYFVSHMLHPIPNGWLRFWASKIIGYYLRPFDEIWVPDHPDINLAGQFVKPTDAYQFRYIGILSRLKNKSKQVSDIITVLISGPEPQRTKLEKKLLKQAKALPYQSFVFVLGKSEGDRVYKEANCTLYSFLDGEALNQLLCESRLIITRSGYSTLMDLQMIGSKALLIPTPGQQEQEYLAQQLHHRGIFQAVAQDKIQLNKNIKTALQYPGFTPIPANLNLPIL